MAEKKRKNGQIIKGMKLQIVVEEAINDVLVVVLEYGLQIYRGVLLDAKNRNRPSGICASFSGPNSSMKTENNERPNEPEGGQFSPESEVDVSASIYRHTYNQNVTQFGARFQGPPRVSFPKLSGNRGRRNIRLRPRQTLCSKCKSTCLESDKGPIPVNSPIKGSNGRLSVTNVKTRLPLTRTTAKKRLHNFVNDHVPKPTKLIKVNTLPKLTKTSPFIKISIGENNVMNIPPRIHESDKEDVSSSEDKLTDLEDNMTTIESHVLNSQMCPIELDNKEETNRQKRCLRPNKDKRPHWRDEKRKENVSFHKRRKKSKHRHKSYDENDGDSGNSIIITENIDSEDSEDKCENTLSNQIELVKRRPRLIYTWRQNKGLSPRPESHSSENVVKQATDSNIDSSNHNHSLDIHSSHSEDNNSNVMLESNDGNIVETLGKQQRKVYRLRRRSLSLDTNPEYEITEDSAYVSYEDPKTVSDRSEECTTTEIESSSDTDSSEYGDGPPVEEDFDAFRPLMMKIHTSTVSKCITLDGRTIQTDDIVWGKIKGFPWWPGRVLTIAISQKDNGVVIRQTAHLAWFGSSTTSHIQCSDLYPFLEDFKLRYKGKKRGPYKLAIKQATIAARSCENSTEVDINNFDI